MRDAMDDTELDLRLAGWLADCLSGVSCRSLLLCLR